MLAAFRRRKTDLLQHTKNIASKPLITPASLLVLNIRCLIILAFLAKNCALSTILCIAAKNA